MIKATEEEVEEEEGEEDDEKDVLDIMKERQYGARKSDRKRTTSKAFGYQISTSQIPLSEDSDS